MAVEKDRAFLLKGIWMKYYHFYLFTYLFFKRGTAP